jgi:hypothetical protein
VYASLRTVTEPAAEPVDIDIVRRHCRVDSTYDNDLLLMYQVAARQWAEAWLNRALITQTLAYTITNRPPATGWLGPQPSLAVLPLWWPWRPNARRAIPLPRAPCQAINSMIWGAVGELVPATTDDYTADLEVEPAEVMLHGALPSSSVTPASVQFEFVAGYGDDGEPVPAPIKLGILLLTAFLYEGRGDVNSAGPDAAWQLMAPFRLWQFAG